jgi:5-methylcytosine-specific restriction endonuclease McrA
MSDGRDRFPYESFVCTKCGLGKPLSSYQKRQRKDGTWWHGTVCHSCGKNPEKTAEYRRRRVESGEAAVYSREWRRKNPGKAAEYVRAWQQRNPEHYGNYMQENPWVQRIYNARRRAENYGARLEEFNTKDLLRAWRLAGVDSGICMYCGAESASIDHIAPFTMGGAHAIDNCVPACGDCNSGKHNFTLHAWVNDHSRRELRPDVIERVDAYRKAVKCA